MRYVLINSTVRGWARNVLSTSGVVLDVNQLWHPSDIRRRAALKFMRDNAAELRSTGRIGGTR